MESADLILLNGLRHTANAGYRSGNRQGCLRGTRKDVLKDIEDWLASKRDRRVFWLNGLAGVDHRPNVRRDDLRGRQARGQLLLLTRLRGPQQSPDDLPDTRLPACLSYPRFRKELLEVLRGRPDVGHESLCSQMEKIIVGLLTATRIPTLIIIDALDECKDKEPASAILLILSRYVDQIPGVKFFITG